MSGEHVPHRMDQTELDYTLTRIETRSVMDGYFGGGETLSPHASQRSLLHDHKSTSCKWGCCCKTLLVIVVLTLLAWGIAVPVYFLIGPGMELKESLKLSDAQPSSQSLRSKSYTEALNGTVLNAVNGSMKIVNQRYHHSLASPFSSEYRSLQLKLETLLSIIFHKSVDFDKAAVTGFKPGIVVNFILLFQKDQPGVRSMVETTLINYLAKHWSMLGTFQVDLGSVSILNIRNRCAVDNGGCSHLCFWSVLSDGFECRCPRDYQLMADRRTCFPSVLPKAPSTVNPCGEAQYACSSGNCVPLGWLCDGVSDCLLGEDEASMLCKSRKSSSGKTELKTEAKTITTNLPTIQAETTTVKPSSTTKPHIVWQHREPILEDFTIPSLPPFDNDSDLEDRAEDIEKRRRAGRPHRYKYFG